ncbi:LOW QUALITY PROTEIN: hypothetical protein PHMEG_00030889 [Phytophthora megakarya]|uniref:MULE transposase domain-containing protein n=1 Tax=Phytophthora megakarya TaxID=4795 RepID=A0A225UZG4_9STRA|nr:LOW QUALITY PROTEIN: hypothetical protein PHMEG_00030889 [Phytophthora megakarya]
MPKRIEWLEKAVKVDTAVAEQVLQEHKSYEVSHSQIMACSLCPGAPPQDALPTASVHIGSVCGRDRRCVPGRGKTVICVETGVQSVYDFAQECCQLPENQALDPSYKGFCREMAANHLRPSRIRHAFSRKFDTPMAANHLRPLRIRHALSRKFDTPLGQLPSLTQAQNFVNYYSRKFLDNHDQVDVIEAWVNCKAFTGSETEAQPFSFGWETDGDARLVVRNGSDANPLVIGITTKAVLLQMNRPPESFVFHLDATYKTNQCDYPVVVVGISDSSRAFHLVALVVVSQETEAVFQDVLLALKRVYAWLARTEMRVMYALADASQA